MNSLFFAMLMLLSSCFLHLGDLSLYSGNKSLEEILARYINLPGNERGRQHNQEFLQRVLGKLWKEANQTYQATSRWRQSDERTDSDQLELPTATRNIDELVTGSPHNILVDWHPHGDPQVQILNFLNSNGFLPLR